MKEGWNIVKIIDVATVVHGRDYKDVAAEQGYPVYGSGANVIAYANDYICEEGTTILGRKGTIDKPVFIEEKFWNIDTAFGIVAKECINKKYLYYGIKSIDWASLNPGGVKPSLTQKIIYNQNIPLPPLPEQERIVAYLDTQFAKIDAMKANAAKALAEAKALFQSALTEAMTPKEGWTYKKLGEVVKAINGLWKGKKEPFVHVGVIRNANFTKNFTLNFDNVEYLDVEARQYATRKLKKGDLIIEKSGGSEKQPVGRAVLFLKDEGEFSFSNFTSVLRINDASSLSYLFLYKYLLFIYKRGDTKKMQNAATGIHNIIWDKYLDIDVPMLSIPEQERIVTHLDALSAKVAALEANYTQTVAECDALKQALLREVFE